MAGGLAGEPWGWAVRYRWLAACGLWEDAVGMFDICDQQELGPLAGKESYSQAQKAARTCSRPSVTPGALGPLEPGV